MSKLRTTGPGPFAKPIARLHIGLAAFLVLVLVPALWVSTVDGDFVRRSHNLVLEAPETFLDDPSQVVVPSRYGRLLWTRGEPLDVQIGPLERGDELKLNLRSECPATTVVVEVGASSVPLIVEDSWREHAIDLEAGGDGLRLSRRPDEACPVHISRISASNVRDYAEGVIDVYTVLDTREQRLPDGVRAAAWLLLIAPIPGVVFVLRRRGQPSLRALLLSSGLLALGVYQAAAVLRGLNAVIDPVSFSIIVVGLPLVLLLCRFGLPVLLRALRRAFELTARGLEAISPRRLADSIRRSRWFVGLRRSPAGFLRLPPAVQFLFWLLAVLALKHDVLFEPPVWDSAMGVFPPAAYLYDTGFDIRSLLQQPNWGGGGPNVHSLSLFTWLLATVMTMTDSALATILVMHLLTLGVFAVTLLLFSRILESFDLSAATVVSATALVLLMPVALVQAGSIYTETWVLAVGVAAWASWRQGRPTTAVLFCVAGLFIKTTAVAIAAPIFLAVLSIRPFTRRTATLAAAVPAAWAVNRLLPRWLDAAPQPRSSWRGFEELLDLLLDGLHSVPDLAILLALALVAGAVHFATSIRTSGLAGVRCPQPGAGEPWLCFLVPLFFVAGIAAMTVEGVMFLPRYLVPVIPFAIAAIVVAASGLRFERIALGALLAACLLSAVNHRGRLYPPEFSRFSIVERSHAYRDFHAVQVAAVRRLQAKPDALPAFIGKEIDYMTSHPMMGYVERPIPNTHPIYLSPFRKRSLDRFPDEFLLLHTNRAHGGAEIQLLLREAETSPRYETSIEESFEQAGFEAALYRIRRRTVDPLAESRADPLDPPRVR